MSEIFICTSKKDSTGMAVLDLSSGSNICSSFKHCVAEPNCLVTVGKSESSHEGLGSAGDYIVSSHPEKPLINIYQWSKPQVHLQCHTQEIIECLGTDLLGNFIFGGTKRGHIYVWDVATGALLRTWHAHFKGVTSIISDPTGNFCISCSEDGMIRAWDLATILDTSVVSASKNSKNIQPHRSWTSHSLPVKGLLMLGSLRSPRVVSCSLDKTVTINDIHSGKQCLRVSLSNSIECLAADATEDIIALGSSSGDIYLLNISISSQSIALNVTQNVVGSSQSKSINILSGHTKAIKSLGFSKIAIGTLVSASEDGSLRWWNVFTRQCLKELKPFSGVGITNISILSRPEILGSSLHKQTLSPLQPLKKYPEDNSDGKNVKVILGPKLIGRLVKTSSVISLDSAIISSGLDKHINSADDDQDEDGSSAAQLSSTLVTESFIALSEKPFVDEASGNVILFNEVKKKDRKRYTDVDNSETKNNGGGGEAKKGRK